MQLYKLIKLSDDMFGGNHPNYIFEGCTIIGTFTEDPEVGKRFFISCPFSGRYLSTSSVVEILSDNKFKTENSTYQLTEHEND